jgi:plastocyanin
VQTDTEGHTRTIVRGRPFLTALALATIAVVASACGGDDTASPTVEADAAGTEVVMKLVAFKPEVVTVRPGANVTWKQQDAGAHTVTSGTVEQGAGSVSTRPDGRFDSGPLETGTTFRFTFAEAGTYPYFCSLHPATMRGQVQVR